MAETNDIFYIERKRDENPKAFGQPVRAKMDSILYNHDIDRSGAIGGAIYGNYYHQLMSNAESIVGDIVDFVLASDSRIYVIS